MRGKPCHHRLRTLFREKLIRRRISLNVRMPFDTQFEIGILLQQLYDFAKDLSGVRRFARHFT